MLFSNTKLLISAVQSDTPWGGCYNNSRRTMNVEETFSKAMVAIDGAGFDWSYMVDVEVPTNIALMAFSD
ncbi:hypothetical protein Tco_0623489, partial [Tanacetum coccineum]